MIRYGLTATVVGWAFYQAGATRFGGWTVVFGIALVLLGIKVRAYVRTTPAAGRITSGHAVAAADAPRALLEHEGGHVAAAHGERVRVGRVKVTRTHGTVQLHARDVERAGSRAYMTIMYAGQAAAGRSRGIDSSIDNAGIEDEQRRMRRAGASEAEIRRETRAAQAAADRYARSAEVGRIADRIAQGRSVR